MVKDSDGFNRIHGETGHFNIIHWNEVFKMEVEVGLRVKIAPGNIFETLPRFTVLSNAVVPTVLHLGFVISIWSHTSTAAEELSLFSNSIEHGLDNSDRTQS